MANSKERGIRSSSPRAFATQMQIGWKAFVVRMIRQLAKTRLQDRDKVYIIDLNKMLWWRAEMPAKPSSFRFPSLSTCITR
jgi:hypothetical protein